MAIDTYNTQKHHFEDVENHPFQLEGFGNLGNLLHARKLMERYEPTLPPCPFCGGPSVLRGRWAYCDPGVQAACPECGCSTKLYVSSVHALNLVTKQQDTIESAILKAVTDWSRRTPIRERIAEQ